MKLLRFRQGDLVRLGVMDGDDIVPLDMIQDRYPTMLSVIAGGEAALADVRVRRFSM